MNYPVPPESARPYILYAKLRGIRRTVEYSRYSSAGMRRRAYDRLVKREDHQRERTFFIPPPPLTEN